MQKCLIRKHGYDMRLTLLGMKELEGRRKRPISNIECPTISLAGRSGLSRECFTEKANFIVGATGRMPLHLHRPVPPLSRG